MGQAHYNIGYAYERGEGVPQDNMLAEQHYKLAAEKQPAGGFAALLIQVSLWRVWILDSVDFTIIALFSTILVTILTAATCAYFFA